MVTFNNKREAKTKTKTKKKTKVGERERERERAFLWGKTIHRMEKIMTSL